MAPLDNGPKSDRAPASMKEGSSSEVDAARDIIAAVKAGDAEALSLALTRHREACEGESDNEDDDEEV